MDLNKLQTLLESDVGFNGGILSGPGSTSSGLSSKEQDVDWDFKSVTIITKSGNTKKRKSESENFEDESDTEIIDPENSENEDSEGKDSEGEDGNDNSSQEIKIGSIIQDFKTGQYGKVTNIHSNGDVDWVPASEDELRKDGFIASMRLNKIGLNRSDLNGFIG